jgi:quinol-cytochrome oxidoreductase complex cytochrome b subunit
MDQEAPTFKRWADDRSGWSSMRARLAARRVRPGNPAFYVGGVLAFLLLMQMASGVLLLLHYQPSAPEAYQSVAFIMGGIPYGDLIRNMHLWCSDLLVLGVILQLFSVAIRRAFRTPNELLWISGLLGFFILLGLAFTGAVLPWSQSAYLQARVGSEIAGQTPFLGTALRYFLRGGEEVTTATLRHAYGFHVAVLPAVLTLLLVAHGVFLRRLGTRPEPAEVDLARTVPIYPDFLVRMAAVMTAALVLVISLATFAERPLGEAAELSAAAPPGARPPWYFLFIHDLMLRAPRELLGVPSAKFIVGAGALIVLLAFFVPFFDRRGSRVTAVISGLILFLAVFLSIHALL